MPYFEDLQYGSRAVLVEQGWPVYLFGSRDPNVNTSYVTNVELTSNVATVTVEAFEGPMPKVGNIITVRGTQAESGLFNVTNAVITDVTLDTAGNGTISFALTNADVESVADAGSAYITSAVVGEDIAEGASTAGTIHHCYEQYAVNIFCDVQFPTVPTAATVKLQTAMRNVEEDYQDAATVATVSAGSVTQSQANYVTTAPFFRFSISGLTGTGTIAATAVI